MSCSSFLWVHELLDVCIVGFQTTMNEIPLLPCTFNLGRELRFEDLSLFASLHLANIVEVRVAEERHDEETEQHVAV